MATKIYNRPYDKTFDSCIRAMKDLGHSITSKSKGAGTIEGETDSSILSWGENISISVKDITAVGTKFLEPCKVEVTINSKAVAQLISWGKDGSNEKSLFNKMDSLLN
jgi:hypothetical protein